MRSAYTPPTEEQKADRRKAATHQRRDTLFQLSAKGDDLYPQALWFNEGSGMWQWHNLTNDDVRLFSQANQAL